MKQIYQRYLAGISLFIALLLFFTPCAQGQVIEDPGGEGQLSVSISGPSNVCAGSIQTYYAQVSGGDCYEYSWSVSGGTYTVSGGQVTVTWGSSSGTVSLWVSDCYDYYGNYVFGADADLQVTVSALPTATVTPSGSVTFCQGGSVTLSATTGSGYTYQWYKDNAAISGATAYTYAAAAAGSYKVTVKNSTNCYATSSVVSVTQQAAPVGATMANTIFIGTLSSCSAPVTDIKDNSPGNCYGDNYGQASDDIYYKFTLQESAQVSISTCGSTLGDTYLHLLDASGVKIDQNDDDGPLCTDRLQASLRRTLAPGDYYVVVEGYSHQYAGSGPITTTISTAAVPLAISPAAPEITPGQAVALSASGSGTFSWSPAIGLSATTGQTVTATPDATTTYTVTATSPAGCVSTAQVTVTVAQNMNHIITTTLQDAYQTMPDLKNLDKVKWQQQIVYYDGLGKPVQQVARHASPAGKDIVTPLVYDQMGRQHRQYLPYVATSGSGFYKPDPLTEVKDFYNATADRIANDTVPYSRTIFENSPLSRVLEQGATGNAWKPGTGRTIKRTERTNAPGEVRLWGYDFASGSVYPQATDAPTSKALSFDGVDDYVQVGDRTQLRLSSTFTLEAWIFPTGNVEGIIINKEGEYEVARFPDGTIRWAFANTSPGWNWINSGGVAPLNAWTHLALTYENGVARTYLNGVLVHTYNGSGALGDVDSYNDFRIGARQNFGSFFKGSIDEVRVWNTARSQEQLNSGVHQNVSAPLASLVGYWGFNEGSGTTARDASGSGNTGTLVSGTRWEISPFYAAGQLYVTETRDEHDALVVEYKDKQGRVVAKKVQEAENITDTKAATGFMLTQYVYDDKGQLRLVIQPEGNRNLPQLQSVAGKITREVWEGVPGLYVSDIPQNTPPTSVSELNTFGSPSNVGDYYGQRIRGYVTAPVSGQYTFWIAADDYAELWLSTSDNPAGKVRIAFVDGWTNFHEWGKYPSQQSALITLEAGKRYYIEALAKEHDGGDNLSVGWQLPGGALERPIPGSRLSTLPVLQEDFLASWCFRYGYDGRGRMTWKQVPGAGPVEMVYNKRDQLILTRDANQAAPATGKKWSFTKYDVLGRPVLTGEITDDKTRSTIQAEVDAEKVHFESDDTGTDIGYTLNNAYPRNLTEANLLSVTYYDKYSYAALNGYTFTGDGAKRAQSVRGQVTGTKVRKMEGLTKGAWLTTATYYDREYRPLESISDNHFGSKEYPAKDRVATVYDFAGKVLETTLTHEQVVNTVKTTRTVKNFFAYDHTGRLTTTRQSTGGETPVVLSKQEYNELGQLVDKKLHSTNYDLATGQGSFLQSVDYRYNIRGWMTSINNRNLSNEWDNDDTDDMFGMELKYNEGMHLGGAGQFNGNIAEVMWQSTTDRTLRGYSYAYDRAGRLSAARYNGYDPNTGWGKEQNNHTVEMYRKNPDGTVAESGYDLNGNIRFMSRRGMTGGDPFGDPTQKTFGEVDNLTYSYAGNRLVGVDDASAAAGPAGDFRDNSSKYTVVGAEYTYDASGNMTYDRNKGISKVYYNQLNLPYKVEMGTKGSIEFIYTASGQKLQKKVYTGTTLTTTTDYVSGFVYENGTPVFVHTSEGRALYQPDQTYKWKYEYHIKDHLGNLRLTFKDGELNSQTLTMEPVNAEEEEREFERVPQSRRRDRVNARTGDHAARLNAKRGLLLGPSKRLEVKRGDKIEVEVFGHYLQETKDNWLYSAAAFLLGNASMKTTGQAPQDGVQGKQGSKFPLLAVGVAFTPQVKQLLRGVPSAYVKYIAYDTSGAYLSSGYRLITREAQNNWQQLTLEHKAQQDGYVEVFLANESSEDVYFDDMSISSTSLDVQENHYDPWGLNLVGIERAGNPDHKFQYNGKEKQTELGLNWMDYGARMYDAQLGRFHTQDRFAEKYLDNTPYHYGLNNPIKYIDINGDSVVVNGSDEFKKQYNIDRANFAKTKEGAAMLQYLEKDCDCLVVISEATSVLGSLKDFIGMDGSADHFAASETVQTPGEMISLQYSQIEGVEVDGVESKSQFTLAHELRHAKDYADGTVAKDAKADPSTVREKGERRAVETENRTRVAFGEKKIRTDYGGRRIVPAGATQRTYDTGERVKESKRKR